MKKLMYNITFITLIQVIAVVLPVSAQAQNPVLPLNLSNNRIPLLNLAIKDSAKTRTKAKHQEFLGELKQLHTGSMQQQEQAVKALIENMPKGSSPIAVTSLLAIGRFYAGQDSSGKARRPSNNLYRKYLSLASQKVENLKETEKQDIFEFILATYRKAEPNSSWTQPPLSRKPFKDMEIYQAFVERQALELWAKGSHSKSISIYKWISKNLTGKSQRALIDRRYAFLSQKQYYEDSNSRTHERRLGALLQEYKNQDLFGANNSAALIKNTSAILSYYERMVRREFDKATKKSAKRKQQLQTIGTTKRLLSQLAGDKGKTTYYQEKLAALYEAANQNSNAVSIYLVLVEGTSPKKQIEYLNAAIRNQSIVASWPLKVSWTAQDKRNSAHRAKLQNLYEKRSQLIRGEEKWQHIAQIGLIDINIGQGQQAFTRWEDLLNKEVPTRTASEIAGYIAHTYRTQNQWAKLESISKLARSKGLRLIYNNKRLNTSDLLALALIEGGHTLLKDHQYAQARVKYQEFTSSFPRHNRYDEGLYYLALAQRGEGLHKDSIASLIKLTTDRPSSKYLERSAEKCSEWSETLALEDEMIYCSKTFIKASKNLSKTREIRLALADLYTGRELYAQASFQLRTLAADNKISKSERIKYALRALDIEERYGSYQSAFSTAQLAASIDTKDDELKATTLAVKARYYFEINNIEGLVSTIANTKDLNFNSTVVREAAAECRFYLALLMSAEKRPEIFNLELKNPQFILEREYAYYNKIKTKFQDVCEIGPTSYCAPAQINIAKFADESLTRIDEVTIAEKLSKATVDKFNNRKNEIYNAIATDNQVFTQRSLATVKEHLTAPNWTLQILWENSTDWNFDRITGETSNGFIQFTPQLITSDQ